MKRISPNCYGSNFAKGGIVDDAGKAIRNVIGKTVRPKIKKQAKKLIKKAVKFTGKNYLSSQFESIAYGWLSGGTSRYVNEVIKVYSEE